MYTSPGEPDPTDTSVEDAALRDRLALLLEAGWQLGEDFASATESSPFHPFVASDHGLVCAALWPHRRRGLRFLEWGSANGVITVMADLLGFQAYGIELDESLVAVARDLADRFGSRATFVAGSFLPQGYRWRPPDGDARMGTLGTGPSGYLRLGLALDTFDVVLGYPWDGEAPIMLDVMRQYGRADAVLLLHSAADGIRVCRDGRDVTGSWSPPVPGGAG